MRIANLLPTGYTDGFDPSPEIVAPDVTVDRIEMKMLAMPTSAVDLLITDIGGVESAIRAERMGYDAVFVNSVADYGLPAIRSAVRIPATGAGEASMLLALSLGATFSIVSVFDESLRVAHDAQLRNYGLVDRCASMRFVTSAEEVATIADSDSFYTRMRNRRQDMIERVGAQVRAAAEIDGAHSIILGCTCMAPITDDMQKFVDVPVINPLSAAYLQAEKQVRMRLSHSVARHRPADASREALFDALTQAGAAVLAADPTVTQDCNVCVSFMDEPDTVAIGS